MSKGTPSFGKRSSGKVHGVCRRCGKSSYNLSAGYCSSCGFGRTKGRKKYAWKKKK